MKLTLGQQDAAQTGGRDSLPWLGLALSVLALAAPFWAGTGFALSLVTQAGIGMVMCLGFGLLVGQGGLFSFGHALYFGSGAFAAALLLSWAQALQMAGTLFVVVLPLLAGLCSVLPALVLGWWCTARTGAQFAMLTLAFGELFAAWTVATPDWFGGEAGLSLTRAVQSSWWGLDFGPPLQIAVLIAIYTVASAWIIAWLPRTPMGLSIKAVRDNAHKAQALGFDPHRVRYFVFLMSAFFCGLSGALSVLYFERFSAEAFGTARSGTMLLFTMVGGVALWFGPLVGGLLMVLAMGWLSRMTEAWLFYVGLMFVLVVLVAPKGLTGLAADFWQKRVRVGWRHEIKRSAPLLAAGLWSGLGWVGLVEMASHWQSRSVQGDHMVWLGYQLNVATLADWAMLGLIALTGALAFWWARRWQWRCDAAHQGILQGDTSP
jgi:branched-chain amino acid transport system permease protein